MEHVLVLEVDRIEHTGDISGANFERVYKSLKKEPSGSLITCRSAVCLGWYCGFDWRRRWGH